MLLRILFAILLYIFKFFAYKFFYDFVFATISFKISYTEGWISYPVLSFSLNTLFLLTKSDNDYWTQSLMSYRLRGIIKQEISMLTMSSET